MLEPHMNIYVLYCDPCMCQNGITWENNKPSCEIVCNCGDFDLDCHYGRSRNDLNGRH